MKLPHQTHCPVHLKQHKTLPNSFLWFFAYFAFVCSPFGRNAATPTSNAHVYKISLFTLQFFFRYLPLSQKRHKRRPALFRIDVLSKTNRLWRRQVSCHTRSNIISVQFVCATQRVSQRAVLHLRGAARRARVDCAAGEQCARRSV